MAIWDKLFRKSAPSEEIRVIDTRNFRDRSMPIFSYSGEISRQEAINEGYMSNDYIFAILNKIQTVIKGIPIGIFDAATNERIEEGDLYKQEIKRVNRTQSFNQLLADQVVYLLLTGDAYTWKKTTSFGFAPDYLALPPQAVTPRKRASASIYDRPDWYDFMDGNTRWQIPPDEVLHFKYFNPTLHAQINDRGLSVLQAGKRLLDASNQLITSEEFIFKNGGANKLISPNTPEMPMSPTDKENIDKALKERRGGAKGTNTLLYVDSPVTLTDLSMTPQELQIYNQNLTHLRRFCSLFGLDSSIFNDPQNKTYANRDLAEKAMYTAVIFPIIEDVLAVYEREVDPYLGIYRKILKDEIEAIQETPSEQKRLALEELKLGVISIPEYRERFGYKTTPTL